MKNDMVIMRDVLGRIWKKIAVAYFKHYSNICPEGRRRNKSVCKVGNISKFRMRSGSINHYNRLFGDCIHVSAVKLENCVYS